VSGIEIWRKEESEMFDSGKSEKLVHIGAIKVVVMGLYFSSRYSYLLFLSLIEIVTIAIALTLFIQQS